MNTKIAKEALCAVIEDIKNGLVARGFLVEYKCCFADIDFNESDEYTPDMQILFAELSVGMDGAQEKMIYERALGICDGEITDEELTKEVASLREAIKELTDFVGAGGAGAFDAFIENNTPTEDLPETDKPKSNTAFYALTVAGAAVIILLMLLLGRLLG